MHPTTVSSSAAVHNSRSKSWPQKLVREVGRLAFQANTLAMRPLALTARTQFLFIVGHMRSGSTLLCHLLCNSADIIGYGETHNNYRRRSDLAKLVMSVRTNTGINPLKYRHVLEKIVSAQHVIDAAVLSDRRTRYVFLVREPLASVASIVAMRRQFQDESTAQCLKFAAQHYTERLTQLMQLAQAIDSRQRCLLLTHGQLLSETPRAFHALERFLQLRSALREEYGLMPTTGQPGIGDPSPNIRLGKIDRCLPRKHVAMPAELQARLEQCYETCLKKLRETIPGVESDDRILDRQAA